MGRDLSALCLSWYAATTIKSPQFKTHTPINRSPFPNTITTITTTTDTSCSTCLLPTPTLTWGSTTTTTTT
ncbi:unnamed protein product, partial [Gadus morhua 'NCC']